MSGNLSTGTEEHEVRAVRNTDFTKVRAVVSWTAICKCGWVSEHKQTELAALNEGDEHRMAIR